MQTNTAEAGASGARFIDVCSQASAPNHLDLPEAVDMVMPFLYAVAVQMISYFSVLAMETDVDQPKNLAKSVIVE